MDSSAVQGTSPDSGTSALPSQVIRNKPARLFDFALWWKYRTLVTLLVWRDIKIKYRQSLFGALWLFCQPLASLAMYTLVFNKIANVESGSTPYPLFCFVGIVTWNLVNNSLPAVTTSLVANANLLQKIYFPRILLPVYGLCTTLVDFFIVSLTLILILVYYQVTPGITILYLPLFILWGMILNLGIGLALSSLNVYFRDITFGLPFALQVWFFLTPIVYGPDKLPKSIQPFSQFNPMMWIVEGFRWSILNDARYAPRPELIYSLVGTLIVFAIGYWIFQRTEQHFSDVI